MPLLFTPNQLKTLIAGLCGAHIVGNAVPDQVESTEYGKIFGSLMAGFNDPTWVSVVPALAEGTKADQDAFKALLAGLISNILVSNDKTSQEELNAWSPAFGSFLKEFGTEKWTSKVPGFVTVGGAPVSSLLPPPAP